MLSMWGDQVAAPLNVVHLGYGFGAVFANLLVKPYLGDERKVTLPNNQTKIIAIENFNIKIPYTITSFLCLLVALIHLIYLIVEIRKTS